MPNNYNDSLVILPDRDVTEQQLLYLFYISQLVLVDKSELQKTDGTNMLGMTIFMILLRMLYDQPNFTNFV